jgi:hypothetical protein
MQFTFPLFYVFVCRCTAFGNIFNFFGSAAQPAAHSPTSSKQKNFKKGENIFVVFYSSTDAVINAVPVESIDIFSYNMRV